MVQGAQAAFFCYSRDDSEFAIRLAEDLKAAGANVWMDQLDIEPGTPWDLAVESAVTNCPRMLVILSPTSINSDNVRDEIAFALSKQKRVIPVLYQECVIPFRLARLQHIDFRIDYSRGLKMLLRTLKVEHKSVAAPGVETQRVPVSSMIGDIRSGPVVSGAQAEPLDPDVAALNKTEHVKPVGRVTSKLRMKKVPTKQVAKRLKTSPAPKEMSKSPADRALELFREGERHYYGQGIPQNYAIARTFFEESMTLGNPESALRLGTIYEKGQGIQQDPLKAKQYFQEASTGGSAAAMYRLAALYQAEKNEVDSLKWYEKAASLGNADALNALGALYMWGNGSVRRDYQRSREHYEQALALGSTQAFVGLGNVYQLGLGVARDREKAREYYECGVQAGDPEAMHQMGHYYGNNEIRDDEKALPYFEMAAKAGTVAAYGDMAYVYYRRGGHENWKKAFELCQKGIEVSSDKAMLMMGSLYYYGRGVSKDYKQALSLWKKVADKGDTRGMKLLAAAWRDGDAVRKDTSQARAWLEKAAAARDTEAMIELVNSYFDDSKVPKAKKLSIATTWLARIDEIGDAEARRKVLGLIEKIRNSRNL